MNNILFFGDQDIDNEDQIMVARLAMVRKMLKNGEVSKEKQEKIIFGHIERKIVQEQEELIKMKDKPFASASNFSTTNYSETYGYTANNYGSSSENDTHFGSKKQKKHIETFEIDDDEEHNSSFFTMKKPKQCKRDPKFKEYEKNDQLLGLSAQVLEFDKAFCEAHQTKQPRFITIIESPDTDRNSNYMDLIQDSNSILSYYQYDALNVRKRSISKQIQFLKKEYSIGYNNYPKIAEEYFRSISTISESAKKCISYRKDKFVDYASSLSSSTSSSSSSSSSSPSSHFYSVLLPFKSMPIIPTIETGKSIEAILYHRLLYVHKLLTLESYDYQLELNGFENDQHKHFSSFIEKTSKSVLLPTSNLNEPIRNLLSKIIGTDDESVAAANGQKDSNGDTSMGETVICNSEETTPTTMAVEIEGASPSSTTIATPQNVLHLLIDGLPIDQIEIISTLLNDHITVKNVSSIYITASCNYSFPMDKLISTAEQQSKVIRLSNLNVETSLNYLEHSIAPLGVIPFDQQFKAQDYPNLVRVVQFIGGHPGLNKLFESVVKTMVISNPKLHIKNISVTEVLDNIVSIVLNHQKQCGIDGSIPISILPKENTDIPLLILLSLVGYNFEEAVAKFPIVRDYYNCGAISISNSSVYIAPILIRYYLTWSIEDFPLGSVFSSALSLLKKFTGELCIWNRFYQDFFYLKKQSYAEIQQNYPQLLESLGGCISKISLKQFFYPNQSLENKKDTLNDKPIKNNDEKEISAFSYRFAIESYWKKDFDLPWDDNTNATGNFTHFIHSPPNSFFLTNDLGKKVKDCVNMSGADKQVTFFFSKKFSPISNTQYFKILDPIQSNYYTCFTTFINEINLEL